LYEATHRLHAITDAPRLEAEVLLGYVTGLSRTALLSNSHTSLSSAQRDVFGALLRRRERGYPLPYLTGRSEFFGLSFDVTPEVLIPRPETEMLVDLALQWQPGSVVDVGTGSGCVAVTLAVHLPEAQITATDISARALRVAVRNGGHHGVRERVRWVQCDLVSALAGPVDIIVANPPYVAEKEWDSLLPSVRHEPPLALAGGPDGLSVVRRLVVDSPRLLRSGGALLIEIGAGQGSAAASLVRRILPGADVVVHPDLAGRDRVLEIRL
jgi:release factor glutamine methyltransferase